jgi:hypothetical protein
MSFEDDFRVLKPEETVGMDLADLWFPLGQFAEQFGLTERELMTELRSGRLVATGREVPGGWAGLAVSGRATVNWLSTGSRIARKAARFAGFTLPTVH